jgi:hypothetical protein
MQNGNHAEARKVLDPGSNSRTVVLQYASLDLFSA